MINFFKKEGGFPSFFVVRNVTIEKIFGIMDACAQKMKMSLWLLEKSWAIY